MAEMKIISTKIEKCTERTFFPYENPCTIAGPKIMNKNEPRINMANIPTI